MTTPSSPRRIPRALAVLVCAASVLTAGGAWAEEPPAKAARGSSGGASSGGASSGKSARGTSPAPAATPPAGSGSGATETVALEIVAKAPKPIPPVELDMLQLRLMLSDLKASFTDKIDEALFSEPF